MNTTAKYTVSTIQCVRGERYRGLAFSAVNPNIIYLLSEFALIKLDINKPEELLYWCKLDSSQDVFYTAIAVVPGNGEDKIILGLSNGTLLVAISGHIIQRVLKPERTKSIAKIAVSPNNKMIAIFSFGNYIVDLYDSFSLQKLHSCSSGKRIEDICFEESSASLVIISYSPKKNQNDVHEYLFYRWHLTDHEPYLNLLFGLETDIKTQYRSYSGMLPNGKILLKDMYRPIGNFAVFSMSSSTLIEEFSFTADGNLPNTYQGLAMYGKWLLMGVYNTMYCIDTTSGSIQCKVDLDLPVDHEYALYQSAQYTGLDEIKAVCCGDYTAKIYQFDRPLN